jgi:deoxyribonucleoside regulator
MEASEKTRLIEVARLYYEHDFSQLQIAKKIGISRPGVSRLLQTARETGIVKIEIIDPDARGTQLEDSLREKFGLKHIIVVPTDSDSSQIKKRLGNATVKYLEQLINPDMILGVSWGSTMREVAKHFSKNPVNGMVVVQLNGGVSKAEYDTHASEIAQRIGEKLWATPFLLPLPAIVDTPELKNAILKDRNIARTLDYARNASIAVYTIGLFNQDSVLVSADYFDQKEIDDLLKNEAVADICSRIITKDGRICSKDLDNRTIGIELDELRKKKYSIAVAGGREKFPAVLAGIRSGVFNVLVTDEYVASKLLTTEPIKVRN